jgi:hypothetical protein
MLGLRLGVWLIAAQLRARLIAAPCANLTTAVTLAQCKQLLVTPAVYSSTALCSTELQHWGGIANFTRAERTLFGGMTKVEYIRSLAATDWSAARAAATTDRQSFFQQRLGHDLGQVYSCTDGSNTPGACMPGAFDYEVSDKTAELLLIRTNDQITRTEVAAARADHSMQVLKKKTQEIDQHLVAMRRNLTSLGASLQTLSGLTSLYGGLIGAMAGVSKCGADMTDVYQKILLDPSSLNLDEAQTTLQKCDGLLTDNLQGDIKAMELSYPQFCDDPSSSGGLRRRLTHLGTDQIAPGYEMTYDECFASHAAVTPAFCAPTCCPPGSRFGDASCASGEQQRYHNTNDMMADKVRRECMQFETYAMSKALHSQVMGLASRASELRRALTVIERNADYARRAVSTCAQDARGVAAAFTADAASLLEVYHCQALITAEMRRIAAECLGAKAGILIPWYGVIKYWDSPCISVAPSWHTTDDSSTATANAGGGSKDKQNVVDPQQSTQHTAKLIQMGQCLIGGILST